MAKSRKAGSGFTKGGYKTRKNRPQGVSRNGLPKIYPPNVNAHLKAVKVG
jgi:hypothetical protein